MFWQTENQIDASGQSANLREELRERLRLVAEFATLGAYDLAPPSEHGEAPHARGREPTQRVFLFARAPETACAGEHETVAGCPAQRTSQVKRPARGSLRHRVPRRRAGVEPAQQPCTWAPAAAAPPSRRDR